MNKNFRLLYFMLVTSFIIQAQENNTKNAIGIRFGNNHGFEVEFSYQKKISLTNQLELDFGWTNDSNTNALKITGIYQWYWKIEKELNWYAGFGGGLGSWNTNDQYKNEYAGDNGLFTVLIGGIGIEYNFKNLPIQLTLDTRPEFILNNYKKNDFGFNVGLGIRYKF